jgi:peroxiredoxin Q/BCP
LQETSAKQDLSQYDVNVTGGISMDQGIFELTLTNQDGNQVKLKDLLGKWLILYAYPKDNTSGCTQEALDFSASLEWFHAHGAEVVGVSPDSVKSHKNFVTKHALRITLLSDAEKRLLQALNAWGPKVMCGRQCMGVIRSTFIFDANGVLRREWRNVKVKGHVEEVKAAFEALIHE